MIKIKFSEKKISDGGHILVSFSSGELVETLANASGNKELKIGIGDKKNFNQRKLIILIRKIIAISKNNQLKKIAVSFDELLALPNTNLKSLAEIFGVNIEMANFEFIKYKTPPKDGWVFVNEILIFGKIAEGSRKTIKNGQVLGDEVNKSRALANTPGGEMTPTLLASSAIKAVKGTSATVKILNEIQMSKVGMGGILGVARGSKEKPKFIIIEYKGGVEKPIVLIGKGVTFDTGGLNIKTGDYMYEMHMDMSGGAAIIHTLAAAAKLGLKKNIVGLIPAVENMPSGESYRPGDILRSMSGKTIEVMNTDAEGRIILADAITYAKKYDPSVVIDVATLTGAAIAALGERASAIFSRDEKILSELIEAGEASGDYVWPLPLWDEYESEIKGVFGDIANASKSKYGGAINGAMFLYQFAKDLSCSWAHIDIAPRMKSVDDEFLAKGSAGAPIRLLVNFLEKI